MKFSALVASVASVGIASAALADSASNNTPGGWPGSPGTGSYSSAIVLPAVLSIDSIVVTFDHTYSSDLNMVVSGSNGSSFNLWDQAGWYNNFGDSANNDLAILNPVAYHFALAGINNDVYYNGSPDPIPSGAANTIAGVTWTAGALAAGTYTINMTDTVGGDGAEVTGWTINYTPVPAPGALALLGLAGLVGTRRRRA